MIDLQCGINKRMSLKFDLHPYSGEHPYGYEPEIINVMEHFLEPGDVFVDAGASIGFHTCLASRLVGEEGLVFAFEPHYDSFKYLAHHVHVANKLNNVALLKLALWKFYAPTLELWSTNELGYSSLHHYFGTTDSETVEGVPLDSLLTENEHPRLIKIDCEGAESEVLLGAEKILKRGVDCVILELNYFIFEKTGRSDLMIRQYMASMGYDMFLINICHDDGKGTFHDPIRVERDVKITVRGGHHINVMFSTEEKVRERWKISSS